MSKRKAYRPKTPCGNPVELAIAMAMKLDPAQRDKIIGITNKAFEAFRCGSGGPDPWRDLADAANVAEELMSSGLAPDHADTFRRAQEVLRDIADRAAAKKTWTLYGHEIESLRMLMWVHEVQLMHCSQGEFKKAVERVSRRVSEALRGNGSNVDVIHVAGILGNRPEVRA